MDNFVLREIHSANIETELEKIGFDCTYKRFAAEKFRYKNIKIYGLNPAQANILKQTALSVGADCATHRDVITGNADVSDAIIGASISQIKKISEKLKLQPFNLKKLGEDILSLTESQNHKTKIVGILNITPDSFSDGGKYFEPKLAFEHLIQMIEDGADIIDIGAESTKPYSIAVPAEEQIKRLRPVIDFIRRENIKTPISIDTRSSIVAEFTLDNGASIINDVSGFDYDPDLPKVTAKYNAGIIIQHSKGTPENMQDNPEYKDVIEEIYFKLKEKADFASDIGIKNIIIDPGIGFGKSKENNMEILNRIEEFYSLQLPVMVGISRKSFLDVKDNDNKLKDSLSLALTYPLIQKGVDYIRVHNVKLHKNIFKFV